jgi:predicted negative regulator of RcsB-dependent stress response
MADALAKGKKPEQAKGGEDVFIASIVRFWSWIQQNLRSALLALAGVALVVAGAVYYVNFKATVADQAAGDLSRLRLSAAPAADLVADLQAYIQRYDGTSSADEARLILARMHLDADDAASATTVLAPIDEPVAHPIGFAAGQLRALAREQADDPAAALTIWRRLGRDARFGFQRRLAQSHVARLIADQGDLAGAVTILSAIAEEAAEEDLAEASVYRIRLGEIKGRLVGAGQD